MRLFCLIGLIVISQTLHAQEGTFEPGYYISPAQDTVRGFLSREPDAVLARGLYFKASQEATAERVIPASAKEVVFTDSKEAFATVTHKYVTFMEKVPMVQGRFMLRLAMKFEQVFDQAPQGTETRVNLSHISMPIGLYWEPELREGKSFSLVAGFAITPTILRAEGTYYRAPRIPFVQGAPPGGYISIKDSRFGLRFSPEFGARFKRFALVARWLSTFGSFGNERTRSVDILFRMRLKP